MSHLPGIRFFLLLLGTGGLFVSCVPPGRGGQYAPRQYAQTTDSATSACLRNPSCYAFHPLNQQAVYEEAFKVEVMSVRPAFGATR